jgi:hypothetical protein
LGPDGLGLDPGPTEFRDGSARLFYPSWTTEPRAASSPAATSSRVGEMASGSPDWRSSSTRPRDALTASRRVRVPVRVASSGAEPSSTVSRSSTAATRFTPTVQPPSTWSRELDYPAQGRARGQTTPPLARPLQNQPSRLVDGVPVRQGASLPRLQAIDPPAPTKTKKLRLFRQAQPPRTRTATGLHSAMG